MAEFGPSVGRWVLPQKSATNLLCIRLELFWPLLSSPLLRGVRNGPTASFRMRACSSCDSAAAAACSTSAAFCCVTRSI